jgi:hypothetical protein
MGNLTMLSVAVISSFGVLGSLAEPIAKSGETSQLAMRGASDELAHLSGLYKEALLTAARSEW